MANGIRIEGPESIKRNHSLVVTNILSSSELIISGGIQDGIKVGDYFNILSDKKDKVVNPYTKEVLGSVTRYKYKLIVSEVFPRYSKLTTLKHSSMKLRSTEIYLRKSLSSTSEYQEEMNVSDNEVNNIFSKYSHATVHIGDFVKKVPQ